VKVRREYTIIIEEEDDDFLDIAALVRYHGMNPVKGGTHKLLACYDPHRRVWLDPSVEAERLRIYDIQDGQDERYR
jgi:hypothetical protein